MRRSKRRSQLPLRLAHHRGQQGMRKLASDRRPDLRHCSWRGRAGRAAPSGKRVNSQAPPGPRVNGSCRLRALPPSLSASNTALVISSTNSGMPSVRSMMSCWILSGQWPVACDAVDHGGDFALPEPVECQRGVVRSFHPGGFKLGSERYQQQDAEEFLAGRRFDQAPQGLSGRSIAHPQKSSAQG